MASRVLKDTNEEVTRIAGGIAPPVLDSLLHGRTRVTGVWTHAPYETEFHPMRDHVIAAMHTGSGKARAILDGKETTASIRAETLNVVARGHSGYWAMDGGSTVSNVYLSHDRLAGCSDMVAEGQTFELLDRVNHVDPKLYSIMKIIADEVATPGPHGLMFLEHAIDLLCLVLLRSNSTLRELKSQRQRGMPAWQVRRVTAYMREMIGSGMTLQDLATIANMSRYHFCVSFRAATGLRPFEYLTKIRMETAYGLLVDSPLSVGNIATAVGYANNAAFSTAFKRYCGASPLACRRNR